jgi:hypothetical protein
MLYHFEMKVRDETGPGKADPRTRVHDEDFYSCLDEAGLDESQCEGLRGIRTDLRAVGAWTPSRLRPTSETVPDSSSFSDRKLDAHVVRFASLQEGRDLEAAAEHLGSVTGRRPVVLSTWCT